VLRSLGNELKGTGHRTGVTKPESSSASTGSDIFVSIVTQTNHMRVYALNDDRIMLDDLWIESFELDKFVVRTPF